MWLTEKLSSNIVRPLDAPTKQNAALLALEAVLVESLVASLGVSSSTGLIWNDKLAAAATHEARVLSETRVSKRE